MMRVEAAGHQAGEDETTRLPSYLESYLARLRQVFKLLFFGGGPKSDPRGSFGTKKGAIDGENAREPENRIQNTNNL